MARVSRLIGGPTRSSSVGDQMNAKRRAASLLLGVLLAGCGSTPSASPGVAPSAASPTSTGSVPSATPFVTAPSSTPVATPTPSAPPAGWIYTFPESSFVWPHPLFGSDGTAYIETYEGIFALDTAGQVPPGWPAPHLENLVLGPDGSVYGDDCGENLCKGRLHRLGSDGREPPGWPYELGCEITGFTVGGDGTAYVGCNRGDTVSIVAIAETGKARPGWPLEAKRSRVLLGPQLLADPDPSRDPTLFVLDQQDSTLTALDPDGHARPGWPVQITGSRPHLILARDGTLVVVSYEGDPVTRTVFTMIGPDGRTLPGWPRRAKGDVFDVIVASDGTLYYVAPPGKVYAHDRAGKVKPGWPVAVPGAARPLCDRDHGSSCLAVGPDGTAYLLGLGDGESGELLALAPDGSTLPGWPYIWASGYAGRQLGLSSNGTVYLAVGGPDGDEIVALDRTGKVKPGWPYVPPSPPPPNPLEPNEVRVTSMTVGPGDRLYAFIAIDPDIDWITTLVVFPPDERCPSSGDGATPGPSTS